MRRILIGTLAVMALTILALASVADSPAEAARGGGGGGGKGGKPAPTATCTTCVLTVTPNPIPLNTTSIVIRGSGFAANTTVYIATPQDLSSHAVVTDGTGGFAWTYERLWHIPGQSPIKAYNNAGKYGTPLATVTVTVQ